MSNQIALKECAEFLLHDEETNGEITPFLEQILADQGFSPEAPLRGADAYTNELLEVFELDMFESAHIQSEAEGNDWLESLWVAFKGESDRFQLWFLVDPDF